MTTTLSPATFRTLQELVVRHCGITIPESKAASLQVKLQDHLEKLGLGNFETYVTMLAKAQSDSELWRGVIERVTTNETYFFRNEAQMTVFSQHLIPQLTEQNDRRLFKRLKIWSAACSTGEEAYSLAILLHEALGSRISEFQPTVLGTDIDTEAVREATQGIYGGRTIQQVTDFRRNAYFQAKAGEFSVIPAIRSLVDFKVLNFADAEMMSKQINMDVIFCRNVLIYFDQDFRKRVVRHLYDSLRPGGYLVIGHSESLRGIHDGFLSLRFPGTLVYQRPEG